MSPKGFAVLACLTAVSVGLAAYAITRRDLPEATAGAQEPVFPGLVDRLNEVTTVKVTAGGGAYTLQRDQAGAWTVAERGGFPADYAKVRGLALSLAGLRLVEPKTASKERLPRLELGDPAVKDAKAKEVRLLSGGGDVLAALVVGKTKYGLYGGGRSGVYVRRAGEDQAWLAAGDLDVPAAATDVVVRDILDVPEDRVARVTLGLGTPAPVVVRKPEAGAPGFALEAPVPPGKRPDEDKMQQLAGSFASLTLQDVKPLRELVVPADAPRAAVETFDGLRLEATVVRQGEGDAAEFWVAFTPSEIPSPAPAAPGAQPPAASGAPAPAAPQPGATQGAAPDASAVGAAAARVAELKPRLDGWAFKLSEYLATRLTWKVDDLTTEATGQS